jgi:DNA (cytosine-5)-methyltransferase 1
VKPRLLDLCCYAGGSSRGYQLAGFEVTGVDRVRPKNYGGDHFIQGDALEVLRAVGHLFDVRAGSPPCQRHSLMSNCREGLAASYDDLIEPMRDEFERIGGPYVIENVVGAPLRDPVMLCGHMFGLPLYRHRLFESNVPLVQPEHPAHTLPASKAGHWRPGTIISVAGHCSPIALAREAMGIDWMTRDELAEAIPPAYTEAIGRELIAQLGFSRLPVAA